MVFQRNPANCTNTLMSTVLPYESCKMVWQWIPKKGLLFSSQNWVLKKKKKNKKAESKKTWHLPSCMLEITYELAHYKAQTQPLFWKGFLCFPLFVTGLLGTCFILYIFGIFLYSSSFQRQEHKQLSFSWDDSVCVCMCVYMHHWNFLNSNAVFSCQTRLWVFLSSRHFFNSNLEILRENTRSFSKTGCQEDRNWMVLAGH